MDLPVKNIRDEQGETNNLAADETAKTQALLVQLNQSTIKDLQDFMKDDPSIDLCLRLREVARRYKAKREVYTVKPAIESKASTPEPEHRLNHVVRAEGEISVLWPLAPSVASLLHVKTLSTAEAPTQSTPETVTVCSALSELLHQGDLLHQFAQRAVVRIAKDMVVKITRNDDVTEVMNLQHICSTSQIIRVPKPMGMLRIAPYSYLFTSFVSGVPLDRIWANLTPLHKANVRQQLNMIFTELRALPIPLKNGYFGGGDPPFCLDNRRWGRKSSSPIINESQFNDFLLSEAHYSPSYVEFIRPCLPENHRVVMTHGDLHPRNIIVINDREPKIAGILNWETGGRYPEYWEFVKALHTAFTDDADDWHLFLPEAAIGKYLDEYIRDSLVGRMVS